jgi:thiaminase (transcriptional activator TenA)
LVPEDAPPPFTESLWAAVGPIYEAILRHPFLTGLADGTLPRDRFAFYITQDSLYLRQFARALAALGAVAPDGAVAFFGGQATEALAVEEALHEGFVRDLGMHPEQVRSAELAPTNQAYSDFLLASVLGRPYHEGLAAVLPCYWIYQRVGRSLIPKGSPDPLYRLWIETYGGDAFDRVVTRVRGLADAIAPTLTDAQRAEMRRRFVVAGRYEWMFWDMAHRLERWPV